MSDPLSIFDTFEPIREMWRGMVANIVDEGFTDEQARALLVFTLTGHRESSPDAEEGDGGTDER